MSNESLGIILYFIIMMTWMIYLVQEAFIAGASALNMAVSTNEGERKQVQVATGMHFDGMEVWLIAALVLTLGAFPIAFSLTLEYLYVPFFLLLYVLITRGVSIEVIYKMESKKWVKTMVVAWTISSILIMFILGIYLTNVFLGYPYLGGEMTKSFTSLFNVTSIAGGLLFVAISFVAGAGWIYLTTDGELGNRAIAFVKKTGVIYSVPILLLLAFMGLNNVDTSIFIGELFSSSILFFILPVLTVLSAIMVTIKGYQQKGKCMFIFSLVTIGLFLMTGFIGSFPYLLPSKLGFGEGISIVDAMVNSNSLTIIVIIVAIFYPIIIFYQSWKYKRFAKKIEFNDE